MATSSSSNLASLGYDIIVGVTQYQIGMFLKDMMLRPQNVTQMVYCEAKGGTPQEVPWDTFMQSSNSTDPFDFTTGNIDPQSLKNLVNADFKFAFKTQMGLPLGIRPDNNPNDLLELLPGSSGSAIFTPEYRIFEMTYLDDDNTFNYYAQQRGEPWKIQFSVNLNLQSTSSSDYSQLPASVRKEIHNMSGSAFAVQQLLFDLATLAPFSAPSFGDIPQKAVTILNTYFVGRYVKYLQSEGLPLLGVAIVAPTKETSVFQPSDLTLWINDYVDGEGYSIPYNQLSAAQRRCICLNYVCVTNSRNLPSPRQIPWNWVTSSSPFDQVPDHDGVVALAFSDVLGWVNSFFEPALKRSGDYQIYAGLGNISIPTFQFWSQSPSSTWTRTQWPHSKPDYITYLSECDAGFQQGSSIQLFALFKYAAQVSWSGQQITIKQQLEMTFTISTPSSSFVNTPVINNQCIDTITLGVSAAGAPTFNIQNTYWNGLGGPMGSIFDEMAFTQQPAIALLGDATAMGNAAQLWLKFRSFATMTNFPDPNQLKLPFFPGDQTFVYKNPRFSDVGDLLVDITYQNTT